MGAYVYGLTETPSKIEVWIDGKAVTAAAISYVYKPWYHYDAERENAEVERKHLAKVKKGWAGEKRPSYTFQARHDNGIPHVGDVVLKWHYRKTFVVDDPDWEGREIGYLIPVGVFFHVGTLHELEIYRLRQTHQLCTGCDLFVEGDRFVMTGPSGRHELTISETDRERLHKHWDGFRRNNYAAFERSGRRTRPGESQIIPRKGAIV